MFVAHVDVDTIDCAGQFDVVLTEIAGHVRVEDSFGTVPKEVPVTYKLLIRSGVTAPCVKMLYRNAGRPRYSRSTAAISRHKQSILIP